MKQVVLDTTTAKVPHEVFAALEREDLQPGDELKLVQKPPVDEVVPLAVIVLVLMAVLWYMSARARKAREQLAAEILNDVFGKYNSVEELERDLKDEYNISVTTEVRPASGWSTLTMTTFERAAYAEDEPDITHIAVKEPNPEYRPWKKDSQHASPSSKRMGR